MVRRLYFAPEANRNVGMTFHPHTRNESTAAEIVSDAVVLSEPQDVLDLMANAQYHHRARAVVLHRHQVADAFFDLRSGLAGEILQKVSNYGFALGIVGDFATVESRALRDFIRESNEGRQVAFVESVDAALEKLL